MRVKILILVVVTSTVSTTLVSVGAMQVYICILRVMLAEQLAEEVARSRLIPMGNSISRIIKDVDNFLSGMVHMAQVHQKQ